MLRTALRVAAPRFTRSFVSTPIRANAISDIYLREISKFKPAAVTAAEAESQTRPWAIPTTPAAPIVEAEGAEELASYEQSAVEVEGASGESAKEEEWFVEEVEEEEHH
ncbi:hypothetical protein NADFUDRAFT_46510 [Nadsonia fulvescens var. elongata DSM 6958]|uniref:Uncharacterized protein n=1 Tax=Nadsonia fulvescens var. elongata DSM 6958 TaxID=857566 RepID=A0A1E3PKU7_9ASCO|nr:hypothetical protein NADFUDRAFT_46510 [Nadsonia fulvescens var. elongata DSM 6958]